MSHRIPLELARDTLGASPQDSHRSRKGFAKDHHRIRIGFAKDSLRIRIGFAWDSLRIPLRVPLRIPLSMPLRIPLGLLRRIPLRIPFGFSSDSHGICTEFLRIPSGFAKGCP